MITFKDISIPKPCSVDYDALPGNEVTRFCGSCDKHVYDFRGKDEAYLNEVYRKTGKVCGIYYADQIQWPFLKVHRQFYYGLATKLVSVALFLKTILSTHDTKALPIKNLPLEQTSVDSSRINVAYQGSKKNADYYYINIDIYINKKLFKSYLMLKEDHIYLPDSIKPNQKIKIIASTTRYAFVEFDKKTFRKKKYHFQFKDSEKITVKINYNKKIVFIRTRRNTVTGMTCPPDFW